MSSADSKNVQVQIDVTITVQLTIYCQMQYSKEDADDEERRQSARDECLSKIANKGTCSFPVKCNGETKKQCKAKVYHIDEHCGKYECTSSINFLKTDRT